METKPLCENCGKEVRPNLVGRSSRFCCRQCSDDWFAAERKQAVDFFRAQGCVVEIKRMKAAASGS
jgi:hypothetical protein